MAIVNFQGTLSGGPQGGGADCFPQSSFNAQLSLSGGSCGKSAAVASGVVTGTINSPILFAALPFGSVTRPDTFYVKFNAPVVLRLRFDDGAGGDLDRDLYVTGNFGPIEIGSAVNFLKAAFVQGTAQYELFVSGQQ